MAQNTYTPVLCRSVGYPKFSDTKLPQNSEYRNSHKLSSLQRPPAELGGFLFFERTANSAQRRPSYGLMAARSISQIGDLNKPHVNHLISWKETGPQV